jgi:hypothetical protein
MKKALVIGLLGLGVSAATSFGQGTIQFNTYGANGGSGFYTTYGSGGSGNFGGNALLLYSFSAINEAATTAGTVLDPVNAGWTVATLNNAGVTPLTASVSGGLIVGPNFLIPTYTGNAPVYFEILAFNGADYASSDIKGHSASWSVAMATGITGAPFAESGNWQVFAAIPEPSTIALAGIGLAGLLAFRRRK